MEVAFVKKNNNQYFYKNNFVAFSGNLNDLSILLKNIEYIELKNDKKAKHYIGQNYLRDLDINQLIINKKIKDISQSEKQFVKLINCIYKEPEIIILNNFDLNLNSNIKNLLINFIRKINEEKQIRFIIISNDLVFLAKLCSHLIIMKNQIIKYQGDIISALKKNKVNKPNIIRFIDTIKDKGVNVEYTLDYKELLKSIYRSF